MRHDNFGADSAHDDDNYGWPDDEPLNELEPATTMADYDKEYDDDNGGDDTDDGSYDDFLDEYDDDYDQEVYDDYDDDDSNAQ